MRAFPLTPLTSCIAGSVALRGAAILAYLAVHGWIPETMDYERVADSLRRGDGLSHIYNGALYRSDCMPVFPFITAGLHLMFGPGFLGFYVFQLACAAGVVWLVHETARAHFGERAALWAAALAAVEPGLVVQQSYKVNVETFSTLLFMAVAACASRPPGARDARDVTVSGCAAALGILTRPDLLAALALPAVLSLRDGPRGKAFIALAWAACCSGVLLLPWAVRNHSLHGRWILTTSTAAQNLWIGNNPHSTETLWGLDGRTQMEWGGSGLQAEVIGAGELANKDLFSAKARTFIRENPGLTARRALRRFLWFWWHHPSHASGRTYPWLPRGGEAVYQTWTFALFLLALAGSWIAWTAGARAALALWGPPVAMALIHAPYYVEGRHRAVMLPITLIFAANALRCLPLRRPD